LRQEIIDKKERLKVAADGKEKHSQTKLREFEEAAGDAARSESDPLQASYVRGGGFSSGRMNAYM